MVTKTKGGAEHVQTNVASSGLDKARPSLEEEKRTELCRWSHGQDHCSTERHQLAVLLINTPFLLYDS